MPWYGKKWHNYFWQTPRRLIVDWSGLIRRVILKKRCCSTGRASRLRLYCTHSFVTRDRIFHLTPAHEFITHRLTRIHTYTGNRTTRKATGHDDVCAGTEPALSVRPFLQHHVARNHQLLGQRVRGCLAIATEKSERGKTLYWGPGSGLGSREVLLLQIKKIVIFMEYKIKDCSSLLIFL